jgi:hypothetical protein
MHLEPFRASPILGLMRYEAVLGPEDVLSERPFTDAENTAREADVMRRMLRLEQKRARAWAEVASEAPAQAVIREEDDAGRRHLLVVPSVPSLLSSPRLTAIGFFGRAREDVDHSVLFGLEDDLIERMPSYGEVGLLSYYDVELDPIKGSYGNLILFSTPEVPEAWYRDSVHRRAVELSPGHYHEVRLHKGSIPSGILDGGELTIERTKYVDFSEGETWFGLRRFDGSAA